MSKILVFLSLIVISYCLINVASVQAKVEITTEKLGVKNPGILPSSPFYFLKEWQRAITKFLTFSPIKKVELNLQYANERAAEIKKLEEVVPNKPQVIAEAVNNYEANMEELKEQLQAVTTTSQNPSIDNLITEVVNTSIKHQELFDNLKDKFEGNHNLENKLESGQQKISEVIEAVGVQPIITEPVISTTTTPDVSTSTMNNLDITTSTITTSTLE